MQPGVLFFLVVLISACKTQIVSEQCVPESFRTKRSQLHQIDLDRLSAPPVDNREREHRVVEYFSDGCPLLLKQKVGERAGHNIICRIEGKHDIKIVVGAHHDRVGGGRGVADNWSGIVLISRLIDEFKLIKPEATWEIIAFAAEESAMLGSRAYVRDNRTDRVVAMINVDTLGMGIVRVDSRSDRHLSCIAKDLARRVGIKLSPISLPGMTGDWEPFRRLGISVLNIHSLDRRSLGKVHTRKDTRRAVSSDRMQDAWLFLFNLSLYLDQASGHSVEMLNPGI